MTGILLSRLDQLFITPLAGTAQLGLYAVAVQISDVSLLAHTAVRDVMTSSDAGERRDDKILASARISFAGTLLTGLVIAGSAPFWIAFLFGSGFEDALPSIALLTCAAVLGVPGSIAGAALSARGRPGLRSLSLAIAATANLLLVLLLVPPLGATGAALATLIGSIIAANLNIAFTRGLIQAKFPDFYILQASDIRLVQRILRSAKPTKSSRGS
jgi:O-antigen/teichoic acid export membrane protein